jgi:hypothetical protein
MSTDTSTTDMATVEPDPAVTNETTIVDTDTAETTETGAGGDSEVVEDQDDDADGGDDGPGREAAKYRRRLREAETERDRLSERIESLQRAEVERLATAAGLRPAALWASGPELADLVADDGTVDASKVSAAIGAAREQLGIPAPPVGPRVPKEGRSPGRPAKPSGREAMIATVMGRDALDG